MENIVMLAVFFLLSSVSRRKTDTPMQTCGSDPVKNVFERME